MKVLCLNKISEKQIKEIHYLVDCCNSHDGTKNELFLSNEFNFYPEMMSFFLYYRDEGLAGVLVTHATLPDRATISAYVLPKMRLGGVFSELLSCASKELKSFGYRRVVYKTEKIFSPVETIMEKYNAKKADTEFLMYYNKASQTHIENSVEGLTVRLAEKKDFTRLVEIDTAAFNNTVELAELNVKQAFENPLVNFFAVVHNGYVLGSCCMDTAGKRNFLYSLCVDPKYHGKGIGTYLLHEVVMRACALNDKTISLTVDFKNVHALNIYLSCGFEVVTEFVFYSALL